MATDPTGRHDLIAAIQRDDPSLPAAQLVADYEAGPDLLRAAVVGMTHDQLLARPVPGRWSTLEIVCHVCDSEQFFADRMKRTLAMNRPLLISTDGWLYPEAVRYHDRDLEDELTLVTLTRRQMARILKPGGWVILMWNERDENDPCTADYGRVIRSAPDAADL